MRYNVRYHELSRQWLFFDFAAGIEVVSVHSLREDAIDQAIMLEKRARKHKKYAEPDEFASAA